MFDWKQTNLATSLAILLTISFLVGCQIPRALTANDIDSSASEVRVRSICLLDGSEIDFRSDYPGYAVIRDSVIVRTTKDGELIEIPLDSVLLAGSTRYPSPAENSLQNLLIGLGIIAIVVLLISGGPIRFH